MQDRNWEIVGAPFGFGTSHAGTEKAPVAIRDAGLARIVESLRSSGIGVADGGDVEPEASRGSERMPNGLDDMTAYAPALTGRLDASLGTGKVPVVLGGDHSISIPSVSAVINALRQRSDSGASVGLLWVDAHPDLETPGPDSTNDLNAMPIAHLLGLQVGNLRDLPELAPKVHPEHLVYIGIRDVVDEERETIHRMGIRGYTMTDIERLGIVGVCAEAFSYLTERTDALVLSLDIDALDPAAAPGVDYPEPGGLTVREAMVVMEFAHRSEKLALVELVEVNPTKDPEGRTSKTAARLLRRLMTGPVV